MSTERSERLVIFGGDMRKCGFHKEHDDNCNTCNYSLAMNLKDALDYAAERLAEIEKAVFCGDTVYSALMREQLGRPIRDKEAWKKRILDELK